jgi:hypothetical protein
MRETNRFVCELNKNEKLAKPEVSNSSTKAQQGLNAKLKFCTIKLDLKKVSWLNICIC